MAGISFLLALLFGGAAFLFKSAASEISIGTPWAGDVCSASELFCHNPEYLLYATVAFAIIGVITKFGSIVN